MMLILLFVRYKIPIYNLNCFQVNISFLLNRDTGSDTRGECWITSQA